MSHRAVLKADRVGADPQSRVVLRGELPACDAPVPEPGVWLSQAELDATREQSFEQGFERGMVQGRQQAVTDARREAEHEARLRLERELRQAQERLAKEQSEKWRGLAVSLAAQTQDLRDRLEAEVTEWTFIAVARLLGRGAPEDVVEAVGQVLADAQLQGPLTVLLHAGDMAAVEASRTASVQAWPAGLHFVADDRVKLGGCLVQAAVQTLDARLETQLALLRESLDGARTQRAQAKAAS